MRYEKVRYRWQSVHVQGQEVYVKESKETGCRWCPPVRTQGRRLNYEIKGWFMWRKLLFLRLWSRFNRFSFKKCFNRNSFGVAAESVMKYEAKKRRVHIILSSWPVLLLLMLFTSSPSIQLSLFSPLLHFLPDFSPGVCHVCVFYACRQEKADVLTGTRSGTTRWSVSVRDKGKR